MAAQTATKLFMYPGPGAGQAIGLFTVYGVTAADTVQLSGWFQRVLQADYYPATGSGTAGATMTVTGNTNLTIPTGPAVDDGYVVAFGAPLSSYT